MKKHPNSSPNWPHPPYPLAFSFLPLSSHLPSLLLEECTLELRTFFSCSQFTNFCNPHQVPRNSVQVLSNDPFTLANIFSPSWTLILSIKPLAYTILHGLKKKSTYINKIYYYDSSHQPQYTNRNYLLLYYK